jgi:hypothetical protein
MYFGISEMRSEKKNTAPNPVVHDCKIREVVSYRILPDPAVGIILDHGRLGFSRHINSSQLS